jgi:endonuclease/exonuclease/phosphatase family metal-dependent hydrolase
LHNTLHIATFNIHKGFTHFNARFSLHHQRDLLRKLHADIIFLQEVQDVHVKNSKHIEASTTSGQVEYLADALWSDFAYGKNSVYPAGHHGNALLSKFPIFKLMYQAGMHHYMRFVCTLVYLRTGVVGNWSRWQIMLISTFPTMRH